MSGDRWCEEKEMDKDSTTASPAISPPPPSSTPLNLFVLFFLLFLRASIVVRWLQQLDVY